MSNNKTASASASTTPIRTCVGHQSTITCLDINTTTHQQQQNNVTVPEIHLLTGCDDGTGRLWDLRTCKSVQIFKTTSPTPTASVTNVAFHPTHPHYVYMTSGMHVHRYDTRMNRIVHHSSSFSQLISLPESSKGEKGVEKSVEKSVDEKHDEKKAEKTTVGDNELNTLVWNKQGTKMTLCDDTGMVYILNVNLPLPKNCSGENGGEIQEESPIGEMTCALRAHDNICIGANLIKNDIQVLSAGLDRKLSLHSVNQKLMNGERKSIWTLPFDTLPLRDEAISASRRNMQQQAQNNPKQLVNPPMLQCLAVSHRYDNRVAVGLANGKCALLNVNKDVSQMVVGSIDAHSYILNQMQFLDQTDKTMLFTCGYDNSIHLWDVASFYTNEKKGASGGGGQKKSSAKGNKNVFSKVHPLLRWSEQFPELTRENRAHIEYFRASPATSTVYIAYDKTVALVPFEL